MAVARLSRLLLQDTVVYGLLCFLFLFGSSLVASALDFYHRLDGHVEGWTMQQLIVAVVSQQRLLVVVFSLPWFCHWPHSLSSN